MTIPANTTVAVIPSIGGPPSMAGSKKKSKLQTLIAAQQEKVAILIGWQS